jgi:hypothetical protein
MLISLSISIRFAVKRRDGCKSSRVACIIANADLPVQTVSASTQSFTALALALHSTQPRSETSNSRRGSDTRVQNDPGSAGTSQILVGKHDQKFQPIREPKRATRKASLFFGNGPPLAASERASSGVFPAVAIFAASCVLRAQVDAIAAMPVGTRTSGPEIFR